MRRRIDSEPIGICWTSVMVVNTPVYTSLGRRLLEIQNSAKISNFEIMDISYRFWFLRTGYDMQQYI